MFFSDLIEINTNYGTINIIIRDNGSKEKEGVIILTKSQAIYLDHIFGLSKSLSDWLKKE